MVENGAYEDPYANVDADLLETYYGVAGRLRSHKTGQTGAGQDFEEDGEVSDDLESEDEDMDEEDDDEGEEDENVLDEQQAWSVEEEESESDDHEDVISRAAATQEPNVRHAAIKVSGLRAIICSLTTC